MQFFRIAREICEKNNISLSSFNPTVVYTLIYLHKSLFNERSCEEDGEYAEHNAQQRVEQSHQWFTGTEERMRLQRKGGERGESAADANLEEQQRSRIDGGISSSTRPHRARPRATSFLTVACPRPSVSG